MPNDPRGGASKPCNLKLPSTRSGYPVLPHHRCTASRPETVRRTSPVDICRKRTSTSSTCSPTASSVSRRINSSGRSMGLQHGLRSLRGAAEETWGKGGGGRGTDTRLSSAVCCPFVILHAHHLGYGGLEHLPGARLAPLELERAHCDPGDLAWPRTMDVLLDAILRLLRLTSRPTAFQVRCGARISTESVPASQAQNGLHSKRGVRGPPHFISDGTVRILAPAVR
jgi:hypothetical protein